jgi:hypothetical protein
MSLKLKKQNKTFDNVDNGLADLTLTPLYGKYFFTKEF